MTIQLYLKKLQQSEEDFGKLSSENLIEDINEESTGSRKYRNSKRNSYYYDDSYYKTEELKEPEPVKKTIIRKEDSVTLTVPV